MFLDVKKAHIDGKVREEEWFFVQLPSEASGGVARLQRWLCGMRPAAKAWEEDCAANPQREGFHRGAAAPTVFHNPAEDVSIVVHGVDFAALGPKAGLARFEVKMKEWYDVKTRG